MRHNVRRVCLNSWKRDQGGVVERAATWLIRGIPLHPTAPCALSLPSEVSSQVGQATPPSGYQLPDDTPEATSPLAFSLYG